MFFHIDAAIGAKRYALAFEPFALLGKVLCEPPGVVYNAVAGIDAVKLRTAQNFSDEAGIFLPPDELGRKL